MRPSREQHLRDDRILQRDGDMQRAILMFIACHRIRMRIQQHSHHAESMPFHREHQRRVLA
jgi:hypothetical protein